MHSLLTLLCIYSNIFCDFYIFLFIVDHFQLNFEYFLYQRIMEVRNVKIERDPRKSHKKMKFHSSKNLYVTWFDKNARSWIFITLLLLITPEFKLEHGDVGSFLKCILCIYSKHIQWTRQFRVSKEINVGCLFKTKVWRNRTVYTVKQISPLYFDTIHEIF